MIQEGRTAYHYTPMCRDPQNVQKLLTLAGADPSSLDIHQHSAKYYTDHKQELELPNGEKSTPRIKKRAANADSEYKVLKNKQNQFPILRVFLFDKDGELS